jgi:hypothetical protein
MAHLARVVEAMRTGGFYGRIMDGGPELDRMKTFLRRCAGEEPAGLGHPQVRPKYPLFPELRNLQDPCRPVSGGTDPGARVPLHS